jgi:hypothetical protein
MTEYVTPRSSDLAANPEQATRQCGTCGKFYAFPDNISIHQCLCGSRTLYPMNDDDVTGGKVWASSVPRR